MLYLYKYLFYSNYKWNKKIDKSRYDWLSAYKTILFLSFVLALYTDFIIRIFYNHIHKAISFSVFGAIFLFNILFFLRVNPYKEIEKLFDQEKGEKIIPKRIVTILFYGLLVVYIVLLFLR